MIENTTKPTPKQTLEAIEILRDPNSELSKKKRAQEMLNYWLNASWLIQIFEFVTKQVSILTFIKETLLTNLHHSPSHTRTMGRVDILEPENTPTERTKPIYKPTDPATQKLMLEIEEELQALANLANQLAGLFARYTGIQINIQQQIQSLTSKIGTITLTPTAPGAKAQTITATVQQVNNIINTLTTSLNLAAKNAQHQPSPGFNFVSEIKTLAALQLGLEIIKNAPVLGAIVDVTGTMSASAVKSLKGVAPEVFNAATTIHKQSQEMLGIAEEMAKVSHQIDTLKVKVEEKQTRLQMMHHEVVAPQQKQKNTSSMFKPTPGQGATKKDEEELKSKGITPTPFKMKPAPKGTKDSGNTPPATAA